MQPSAVLLAYLSHDFPFRRLFNLFLNGCFVHCRTRLMHSYLQTMGHWPSTHAGLAGQWKLSVLVKRVLSPEIGERSQQRTQPSHDSHATWDVLASCSHPSVSEFKLL